MGWKGLLLLWDGGEGLNDGVRVGELLRIGALFHCFFYRSVEIKI